MSHFEVVFTTPTIGHSSVPIGIDGQGRVELGPDAVVVRGLKQVKLRALTTLLYLAVFLAFVAGAVLASSLGFEARGAALAGMGFASGLGAAGGAWLRTRKAALSAQAAQPLVLTFPWQQVKGLGAGEVGWVLQVKRSLFNTESVHFTLVQGTAEALTKAFEAARPRA
jgi:hypothetical protein